MSNLDLCEHLLAMPDAARLRRTGAVHSARMVSVWPPPQE